MNTGLKMNADIKSEKEKARDPVPFELALESSPAAIMITDTSGKIIYINNEFTILTGYSIEEAVGKNPRILKSGYHSTEFYGDLWNTIVGGKKWRKRIYNRNKKGAYYWESASISPIFDNNGNISHFVAVKEDITSLKDMEDRLIIEHQKHDSIIDLNPDPIIVTDMEGRPVRINRAWIRLHNGRIPAADYSVFNDSSIETEGAFEKLRAAGKGDIVEIPEIRYAVKGTAALRSATIKSFSLTAFPLFSPVQEIENIVVVFRDITDLRTAEDQLRKSKEDYKYVIDNVDEYIYSVDLKDGDTVRSYHSPRCEHITGYPSTDLIRNPELWRSIIHPDDRDRVNLFENNIETGGLPSSIKHRIIHRDGSTRWISNTRTVMTDETSSLLRINGFILDITKARQIEYRLRASEEKFRSISDYAGDGIVMLNADGEIILWNLAAEKILGYSENEAAGKKIRELFTPEADSVAFMRALFPITSSEKRENMPCRYEFTLRRKTGPVCLWRLPYPRFSFMTGGAPYVLYGTLRNAGSWKRS